MASIEEDQSFAATREICEEAEDAAEEAFLDSLDGEIINATTGEAILTSERSQWYQDHFAKACQEYATGDFTRIPL